MSRRRLKPTIQPGPEPDLLTAAEVNLLDVAAERVGREPAGLVELAAAGRLAPWIADRCPARGWLFHPRLTRRELEAQLSTGKVWIPNLGDPEASLTTEWAAHAGIDGAGLGELLDWLRTAEDTLNASREEWMWWCSHAPDQFGGAPAADVVALRWGITSRWYDMLTDAGIGHNTPHQGTCVTVVVTTETPDSPPHDNNGGEN